MFSTGTSLELRSLFCKKKLNIPESAWTVELPQKFVSECQIVGGSIETLDPSEKLDMSESPPVGRLVETMEHPEKADTSVGIVELPQKFALECPTAGGSVEIVEPLEKSMSEFHTVDRSAETMEPLEKLTVSESPTVNRFAETEEPPEKLDIAEFPITGRSLEQMTIAPETPIKHTALLRSSESPEGPEISSTDSVRLGFTSEETEPSPSKDNELGLNMLNEVSNDFVRAALLGEDEISCQTYCALLYL